jgi:hypothetical protein
MRERCEGKEWNFFYDVARGKNGEREAWHYFEGMIKDNSLA